ncbi:MAG: DUF3783 domain-containing protein [Ruminococcaceae bacterium]|nr:DUF3783 domain-containing protein [Oscillospiraceae bacterium]
MRAKVLLYRLGEETETGRALRAVLRERSIPALTVDESLLGETVGRLASANANGGGAPPPDTVPETPFMLLCALGDRQLDRLLADMRRAGVSVPYKAVLTDTNRSWTLGALIAEVVREHELMTRQS